MSHPPSSLLVPIYHHHSTSQIHEDETLADVFYKSAIEYTGIHLILQQNNVN